MEQNKNGLSDAILENNLNDQVSLEEFFQAFGYKPDDTAYLRRFKDKNKGDDHGHNMEMPVNSLDRNRGSLEELNRQDYGIFFVVNGDGQQDKQIKHARAQFTEIDPSEQDLARVASGEITIKDLLKQQLEKVKSFPLEPSIMIMTWKSLYFFWLLIDGDIKRFRGIQKQLIQYFGSDPSIVNESRVMRLPGFEHRKHDPVMVKLIKYNPELRYTQDQLQQVLPEVKRSKKPVSVTPSENTKIISVGEGHAWCVSKIGEMLGRLKGSMSDEAILSALETEFLSRYEDPDRIVVEDFRESMLKKIKDFRQKHAEEESDPEYWSYNMKAWKEKNPNTSFEASGDTWEDVRAAGDRSRERDKRIEDGLAAMKKSRQAQSASESTAEDSNPDQDPDDGKHYLPEFYEVNAKTGVPARTLDPVICNWIIQHYTFFVLGDMPYFMDEYGRYALDKNGVKLKQIIQSCIVPRLCKDGTITAIYRMLLYQGNRKEYDDLNAYPVEWVPFRNGLFDPVTLEMHPIKPEHYLINMLPHSYDPDARAPCPTFDKLLQFQLPEKDEREQWLEYGGSCFNRDTSPQKWMIIKGGGGTGKSTQLNVLICCVGEENVSNETLQGLTERFNATVLFGKLVNICADISSQDMDKIDVLKKITGEDKNGVKHELKGKDSFYFTPFCKLLFSANEIPLNRDEKSNAYYRRLLITVMDRKPDKADRRLQKKLIGEIDGIIHRYMEALHRFYEHGGVYVESKRSIAEVNRLRHSADSVIAFFDEMIEKNVSGRIERSELFRKYEQYCQTEDRKYPVTRRTLFDRFRDFGVSETKDSNGNRCFIGIRFRSDDQGEFINDGEFLNVESENELEEDIPF